MFHKKVSNSPFNADTASKSSTRNENLAGLSLVDRAEARGDSRSKLPSSFPDLVMIAGRRCSSFFAEAAVLVLVFGILDFFMLKGRIELPWIVGALAISLVLLAASVTMDFAAHRWIKAHP